MLRDHIFDFDETDKTIDNVNVKWKIDGRCTKLGNEKRTATKKKKKNHVADIAG